MRSTTLAQILRLVGNVCQRTASLLGHGVCITNTRWRTVAILRINKLSYLCCRSRIMTKFCTTLYSPSKAGCKKLSLVKIWHGIWSIFAVYCYMYAYILQHFKHCNNRKKHIWEYSNNCLCNKEIKFM